MTELQAAMGRAKVSVQELADAVGVSRQSVYLWVSGRSEPSDAHKQAMRALLGKSLFMSRTGEGKDGESSAAEGKSNCKAEERTEDHPV